MTTALVAQFTPSKTFLFKFFVTFSIFCGGKLVEVVSPSSGVVLIGGVQQSSALFICYLQSEG